ncbi:hypothetical protein SBBP2_2120008 [Burkholderiales bacterium]|nr:hypothetical protein SBBP2_2120008 [Burkholderiales bacterium]
MPGALAHTRLNGYQPLQVLNRSGGRRRLRHASIGDGLAGMILRARYNSGRSLAAS